MVGFRLGIGLESPTKLGDLSMLYKICACVDAIHRCTYIHLARDISDKLLKYYLQGKKQILRWRKDLVALFHLITEDTLW
jgi:hypothetical protein